MNGARISSHPDLVPMSTSNNVEDLSLEGISANVKLLMKLLQDHQEASQKGTIDERKEQRFAGMMTVIDDVKTRLQKSQSSGKKSKAELRRCNTDLRVDHPPKEGQKKEETLTLDEKEKLQKDLNTSYAAQKRLGVMCASLGREKDIIARELTRKVQELHEMEEHVNDLRAQNERLSAKIQACVAEQKEVKKGDKSSENNIDYLVSQQRNKELSEQLSKSLEGYKMMKRKLKEVKEERNGLQTVMEEIRDEIQHNVYVVNSLKKCISVPNLDEQATEIDEKIASLEHALKRLEAKTSSWLKHEGKQKA
ncbi:Laminin subunit alpha-2 [Bienertia sinuspersici]